MAIGEFLAGMFGSRGIEVVAALLGLINVALIVRRSLWNYPFGIVMVILYGFIFFEAKLYSDAMLQIFFLAFQLLGLRWWLQGRDAEGLVIPRRLPAANAAATAAATLAGAAALGWFMSSQTDAALPWWNALTTISSVTAQTLMAARYVESWIVWIAVDVVAIGVYLAIGLAPTAALYAVFLCLAVAGWVQWSRAFAAGQAVAA